MLRGNPADTVTYPRIMSHHRRHIRSKRPLIQETDSSGLDTAQKVAKAFDRVNLQYRLHGING